MRQRLQSDSGVALSALNLYGFISFKQQFGERFSIRSYATATGFSKDTVSRHLGLLKKAGLVTANNRPIEVDWDQEPVAEPPAEQPETTKPEAKPTPKPKKKETGAEQIVAIWNEHKPKKWAAIQSLGKARQRSIKGLGGYKAVIELLPRALKGAKADKWWADRAMDWENVVGTGAVPKGNLEKWAESCADAKSDNLKASNDHPDFFPPDHWTGSMRPKHNRFADAADREKREAEAREFYSTKS